MRIRSFARGSGIRSKRIHESKVRLLLDVPAVILHKLQCVPSQRPAKLRTFAHHEHATSKIALILIVEKRDDGIVEVVSINGCVGNNQRHAKRHELQDLRAEGLIAEWVLSLGNDSEVSVFNDPGNLQ